jgi:pimeloyl-ACP methyl ester carboxylesterase
MARHHRRVSILFALVAGTAACAPARAAGDHSIITGRWEGAVVREGAIQRLDIEFAAPEGPLEGTFSIPELGLYREPLTEIDFVPPGLTFRFIYGTFTTAVHSDIGEIVGGNDQWGPPVRLHLKKIDAPPRWRYEGVRFRNGAVELAGTLVLPAASGPHPAAVVICGSYPQGRHDGKDGWVYRGWGEALAERGVAALVYDKRGVGESTGDWETCSLQDLADDALAGAALLRAHAQIDPARLGLVGLSQGGWIAPIAAVKDSSIAFIILNVAPAVSVAEQEIDAVANQLRSEQAREAGVTDADVAEAQAFEREMFEVVAGRTPWSGFEPSARRAASRPWAKFLDVPTREDDLAWWRRNQFDPAATLRQLRCPVLALFGENDGLVLPATNVPLMEQYLREAGNTDVTVRVFPGVGHGCELPRRLIGDDWKWPSSFWVWSRKAPGFYAAIARWLRDRKITP